MRRTVTVLVLSEGNRGGRRRYLERGPAVVEIKGEDRGRRWRRSRMKGGSGDGD